jgi:hypothetical protein
VIALHETWRDGMTSFAPARTARVRRVQGDEVLLLCNEHAEELKKEEK